MILKFNKQLYPMEIVSSCVQDYATHLHAQFSEGVDYAVLTFPDEEEEIAYEFANYVLAGVRAHAH